MRHLKRATETMLLLAGVWASLATSEMGPLAGWNETWVVSNLFAGQTAVPRDHEIRLTVGYRDFVEFEDEPIDSDARERAAEAFKAVAIRRLDGDSGSLSLTVDIADESSVIRHAPFARDARYVLDLTALEWHLLVDRSIPDPIEFTTRAGPTVTGLWRNGDTLIVSFSEPMDPETLWLSQLSVDLLWEADGELHSIASDLNLADFAWETDGNLFLFAPIGAFADAWVVVADEVRGLSGASLDGDGDGVAEEGDDFADEVFVPTLPVCYARDDIPAPCIGEDEIETWW